MHAFAKGREEQFAKTNRKKNIEKQRNRGTEKEEYVLNLTQHFAMFLFYLGSGCVAGSGVSDAVVFKVLCFWTCAFVEQDLRYCPKPMHIGIITVTTTIALQ